MYSNRPRLVLGALRGSAGKTTLAVALSSALKRRGHEVLPFKKGPDYIDAAWLSLAASNPCRNLDTFMMGRDGILRSFSMARSKKALSIVEGNRGLYDGVNPEGEHSTAELAKILKAPVVLVVDCDKVTRTMAAMVLGCMHFDPAVEIRGVILNRVGGSRHAAVVRRSVEESCGLPVLGTVPRIADIPFSERHLGLIPPDESRHIHLALKRTAEIAEENLDVDGLIRIAESAPHWEETSPIRIPGRSKPGRVAIGVIRDAAFHFYYPENLQALADRGADIVRIDALHQPGLPRLDALYIGGGFPETHAGELSRNERFLGSLRDAAEEGLPIYAECGGFIYLGESLEVAGRRFPMAGVLPVQFEMEKRPQGHGYVEAEVEQANPFLPVGTKLKGHEFHYSRAVFPEGDLADTAYGIRKGRGIDGKRDGFCRKNVLAGFTHLHALGTPEWADGLVRAAQYRIEKTADPVLLPDYRSGYRKRKDHKEANQLLKEGF